MGLFDFFTGGEEREAAERQRADISAGKASADAALTSGYTEAKGTRENYLGRSLSEFDRADQMYDSSRELIQPYLKSGSDANNLYRIALGLDGQEKQAQFFNEFNNDAGYNELQKNAVGAVENSAAARGGLFSGGTVRGITDRVSLMKNNLFTDRLNRLNALGQSGSQAAQFGAQLGTQYGLNSATARAGLIDNTGGAIGDMQFGLGQLRANSETGAANAIGATRAAGAGATMNNLLGIGKVAASLFNPLSSIAKA